RLSTTGDAIKYHALKEDYVYDGMDTCAVDGLCATDCPVNINTGDLIKRLRKENHSSLANKIATSVARNFKTVQTLAVLSLQLGKGFNSLFGKNFMHHLTVWTRKIIPVFPVWPRFLIGPAQVKARH